MTYKHIKFFDSPTMRSLEKIAYDKGWVKKEPDLVKQASKQSELNYEFSDNLMENIVNLCAGLRTERLEKEASELEINYFNYKKAQTMYDTHNETGEDVIQFAHPKGSHKLENVDSDEAVIEDILDRHLKIVNMVNKKPTGKLSNAKDIIYAVKLALGATTSMADIKANLTKAMGSITKILRIAEQGGGLNNIVMNWGRSRYKAVNDIVNKDTFTLNDITDVEDALDALERNFHPNLLHNWLPEFLNKGVSTDIIWDKMKSLFTSAHQYINTAKELSKNIALEGENTSFNQQDNEQNNVEKLPVTEVEASPIGKLNQQISLLKNKLKGWLAIRSIARNSEATKWLQDEIETLDDIASRYGKIPEDQITIILPNMQKEVNEEVNNINSFENDWVKA